MINFYFGIGTSYIDAYYIPWYKCTPRAFAMRSRAGRYACITGVNDRIVNYW